jgi:HPt (histidine-containing phosphotransfer) domain-containing protein
MMETTVRRAEIFDSAQALSSVGGDNEFLSEVVGIIRAAWPTLLADLRDEIARGDLPAVEATAHLAKAAAGYVSARRSYESALQLETVAGKGDLQAIPGAVANLEREVLMLQFFLATHGENEKPS